mmetsp:Transcript_71026/g.179227  ORF Transcript_71026/g.179227 Transcript_71026/m.179227 type:complete len:288 (+) Transcript_71026:1142-2005(+)
MAKPFPQLPEGVDEDCNGSSTSGGHCTAPASTSGGGVKGLHSGSSRKMMSSNECGRLIKVARRSRLSRMLSPPPHNGSASAANGATAAATAAAAAADAASATGAAEDAAAGGAVTSGRSPCIRCGIPTAGRLRIISPPMVIDELFTLQFAAALSGLGDVPLSSAVSPNLCADLRGALPAKPLAGNADRGHSGDRDGMSQVMPRRHLGGLVILARWSLTMGSSSPSVSVEDSSSHKSANSDTEQDRRLLHFSDLPAAVKAGEPLLDENIGPAVTSGKTPADTSAIQSR